MPIKNDSIYSEPHELFSLSIKERKPIPTIDSAVHTWQIPFPIDGYDSIYSTTENIKKQFNQVILGTFDGYSPVTNNSVPSLSVTKLQEGKTFVILDAPIIVSCHWCEERGKYIVCNAARNQPCLYCQVGNSVRLRFFVPIRYLEDSTNYIVELSENLYQQYKKCLEAAIDLMDKSYFCMMLEKDTWEFSGQKINICSASKQKNLNENINKYLEEYGQIKHSLQQPVENYLKQEGRIVEYKNDVYVIEIVDSSDKILGKIDYVPYPLLWLLGFDVNPNNRDLKLNHVKRDFLNALDYNVWHIAMPNVLNFDWTQSVEMFCYVLDTKTEFFLFEKEHIQHSYPFEQLNFDLPKIFNTKNIVRISRNFHLYELQASNIMLASYDNINNTTRFATYSGAETWLRFFLTLNSRLGLSEDVKLFLRCKQLKNPSKCSTKQQQTTNKSDCVPF